MIAKHNQMYVNGRHGLVKYTLVLTCLRAFCLGTAPVEGEWRTVPLTHLK